MSKIWNNIKKTVKNQYTIKYLILLLFLVLCIVLFIVIQQQDDTMNNLVNKSNESFETTGIIIEVNNINITNYNENDKLQLLNSDSEFNFVLKNLLGKYVSKINFINTFGNYQNVELTFDNNDEDMLEFTQFINLDTAYKMVVYYSDNDGDKIISHTFQTSMELNYKLPGSREIDPFTLTYKGHNDINSSDVIEIDMEPFNYVTFIIEKPNLNKLRIKLLETDFEDDNNRNKYLKKLQQFDKLVPLKFDANLSLIKNLSLTTNTTQYVDYSDLDLREYRKKNPIYERFVLPNPNCSSDNCQLQIRNVVKDQSYNIKIRLEYYYLDNIRNIRATPYLEFKFKVKDNDGSNSFSISKLNIVNKLEENKELTIIFDDIQKKQDNTLDNIEKNFKNLIN